MANYYYLGRSEFPTILVWVSLSVLTAFVGLVTMLFGLSLNTGADARVYVLKDEKQAILHEINGGDLDSAMNVISTYRSQRGGVGDAANLEKSFVDDANLERRHAKKVMAMIEAGASDEELKLWLASQVLPGLNLLVQEENDLILFYKGFKSGGLSQENALDVLERFETIPDEVRDLIHNEGFVLDEGATAMLNQFIGEKDNVREEINVGLAEEKDLILKVKDMTEKRNSLFPKLKEILARSRELDEEREQGLREQSEKWSAFLEETRSVVKKWREIDADYHEKDQLLIEKQNILKTKIQGQDYIPPLDLVDARVIEVDLGAGRVVIALGRRDGLRKGQGFDVYKMKGDILQHVKGRVEVVKVMPDYGVCRVLEGKALEPISVGDVVADGDDDKPFDRKILPSYVLSGQFIKNYSRGMVRQMILSSGGLVKEDISKNVACVVIGDRPKEEDIEICRELGVRTVRVRDLPRHLDYSPEEIGIFRRQSWE
jgi:hypothetical protein